MQDYTIKALSQETWNCLENLVKKKMVFGMAVGVPTSIKNLWTKGEMFQRKSCK